jgi:hypothetical protein
MACPLRGFRASLAAFLRSPDQLVRVGELACPGNSGPRDRQSFVRAAEHFHRLAIGPEREFTVDRIGACARQTPDTKPRAARGDFGIGVARGVEDILRPRMD